jgi:hypothetical protein
VSNCLKAISLEGDLRSNSEQCLKLLRNRCKIVTYDKRCSINGDVKEHFYPSTGGAASSATSSPAHN